MLFWALGRNYTIHRDTIIWLQNTETTISNCQNKCSLSSAFSLYFKLEEVHGFLFHASLYKEIVENWYDVYPVHEIHMILNLASPFTILEPQNQENGEFCVV